MTIYEDLKFYGDVLFINYEFNENDYEKFIDHLSWFKSSFRKSRWSRKDFIKYANRYQNVKRRKRLLRAMQLLQVAIENDLLKSKDDINFYTFVKALYNQHESYRKSSSLKTPCSDLEALINAFINMRSSKTINLSDRELSKLIHHNFFSTSKSAASILQKIKSMKE